MFWTSNTLCVQTNSDKQISRRHHHYWTPDLLPRGRNCAQSANNLGCMFWGQPGEADSQGYATSTSNMPVIWGRAPRILIPFGFVIDYLDCRRLIWPHCLESWMTSSRSLGRRTVGRNVWRVSLRNEDFYVCSQHGARFPRRLDRHLAIDSMMSRQNWALAGALTCLQYQKPSKNKARRLTLAGLKLRWLYAGSLQF